jgi:hypothetical protein
MYDVRDGTILFQIGALHVEAKEVGKVLEMYSRSYFALSEVIISTKTANKIVKNPQAELLETQLVFGWNI